MFVDRADAGRQLAEQLRTYEPEEPLILALPRGGVPIGYEIAKELHAPLDVLIVRKVGAPWNPELGIGAVAAGMQMLDEGALHALHISPSELEQIIEQEKEEVNRRSRIYRQEKPFPKITGKTIILVDDGIATGGTIRMAVQVILQLKPRKLILAVPVGPQDVIQALQDQVDDLICLDSPQYFYALSTFYQSFPQVSDDEVVSLLNKAEQSREKKQSP